MAKATVYNLKRESVGEIDLADEVFSADINEDLFYEVVKAQLASRRVGSAKTQSRSEVSYNAQKMYRQKGTGRARHGSASATQFRGGGRPKGPRPRSYAYRPPRKMRVGALKSALSLRLKEGRLTIVDSFDLAEIKTRQLEGVLKALQVERGSLIVDQKANEKLRLSARNLKSHIFLPPEGVNVYDLLRHPHLILTKDAVEALTARCS